MRAVLCATHLEDEGRGGGGGDGEGRGPGAGGQVHPGDGRHHDVSDDQVCAEPRPPASNQSLQ